MKKTLLLTFRPDYFRPLLYGIQKYEYRSIPIRNKSPLFCPIGLLSNAYRTNCRYLIQTKTKHRVFPEIRSFSSASA